MAGSKRLTKREKVALWRARIQRGLDVQKVFYEGEGRGKPPGADFAIDCFRGNTKPDWWPDTDAWIHVGKLKAAVRSAVPSLMYANPQFKVWPALKDFAESPEVAYAKAKAKELWLNHVWKEANGDVHARVGIQNAFFDIGSVKVGYLCDFQDDEDRGVFLKDESGNYTLDEYGDPVLERGKFLTDGNGEIMRDETGFPIPHPGRITKEKWFIEVTDTKMLLFDVESGPDFKQHRYLIEMWIRPLAEVQADPRFPKAKRDGLSATENIRGLGTYKSAFEKAAIDSSDNDKVVERDEERLRGYDIYDFQNNRYMVLAESGSGKEDEFLLDDPMPDGMEHGPFRFLKYTEDIGSCWYPQPDAIDMAILNQEYDLTRSQMVIHREHTKTRYLETVGAFEGEGVDPEEERAKWQSGGDATLIKVSSPNAILPAPKANLDGSFMQAVPNIAADFNEVGGMPGEVRGVADAESATQASILASGAELRNSDRRDNQVQKWLCEIGRALLISGQQNAELDTIVMEKIFEETGQYPFKARKISKDELLGEFEVTVEIGSTSNKNDPRNLQNLATLLQAIGQNPWIATAKGLMRRYLDSMQIDPQLADELYEAAVMATQQQSGGSTAASPESGQMLPGMLSGLINNQGGAPTGAPAN